MSLAVVIDEVQWCDEASLRLLDSVLRAAAGLPLLVVLVRRAGQRSPADRALAAIAAQRRCHLLALPGTDAGAPVTRSGPLRAVATAMAVLDDTDAGLVSLLSGVPKAKARAAVEALLPLSDRTELLAELPREEAVRLHTKAARLLNDAARPAAEIANHLLALPRLDEPWMPGILLDAAAAAERVGALGTAVRYLVRVTVARPGHLGARLALARALTALDPDLAMAELDEVVRLPLDPRSRRTIVTLFTLAAGAARPGDLEPVKGMLAKVDDGWQPAAFTASVLAALSGSRDSAMHTLRARVGTAPAVSEQGQEHARRALELALHGQDLKVAASWARSLLRHDSRVGGRALLTAAAVLNLTGDMPDSLGALDSAVADGVAQGDPATIGEALAVRSMVSREYGDPRGADRDARAAALVLGPDRPNSGSASWRITLASALYYADEPEQAERLLRAVPSTETEQLYRLIWLARTRVALGDAETALRYLAECERRHDEAGFASPVLAPWWFESARILGRLERPGEAAEHADRGRDLVRDWPTPQARGLLLLAEAAATRDPVERLRAASGVLATSFFRIQHARAEYLLGRTLLLRGDRAAARRHLRQAALLATTTGWRALATSARRELSTAGGRMRLPVSQGTNLLTEREREVAEMVAAGATNRDVAAALFVSPRTVELHLTNVYRKLAVTNREGLAAALPRDSVRPLPAAPAPRRPDDLVG